MLPSLRSPSNEHEFAAPILRRTQRLHSVVLPTRNASGHSRPIPSILDPAKNLHSPISTHLNSPRQHPSTSTPSSSKSRLPPNPPRYFAFHFAPPAPFDHECGYADPRTLHKIAPSRHNKAAPTQSSSKFGNHHALESGHRHSSHHNVYFVHNVHTVHCLGAIPLLSRTRVCARRSEILRSIHCRLTSRL